MMPKYPKTEKAALPHRFSPCCCLFAFYRHFSILGHKAHREPVVAADAAVRIDIATAEAEAARVAAIAERRRPVVAVRAHIEDRSAIAVASGREEYGPGSLHLGPVGIGIDIRPI